jgi:cytochrome c oxidase assembly factor CtaG
MTWSVVLLHGWDLEPSVIVGCVGLLAGYLALTRGRDRLRLAAFVAGDVLLLLALVSPLDALSDNYLFSAHMVQHLFLILIVPPLLLLGMPRELFERALQFNWVRRIERRLRHPVTAWALASAVLIFWHIPRFYDLTIQSENVHIVEHLSFLVFFTIFWWPVLSPFKENRLSPMASVVYLFAGMAVNAILGIIITFAPAGFYSAYLHPADPYGWLSTIRNQWGITPHLDQEIGGIIMWVPGSFIYLVAMMSILAVWFSHAEPDETPGRAPVRAVPKLAER